MPAGCIAERGRKEPDLKEGTGQGERETEREGTGREARRLVGRKRLKEPAREARREEKPGRLNGGNIGEKKVRGQSESDARVPVRAEEMKRSLRPEEVKTEAGERDGGEPKGEA